MAECQDDATLTWARRTPRPWLKCRRSKRHRHSAPHRATDPDRRRHQDPHFDDCSSQSHRLLALDLYSFNCPERRRNHSYESARTPVTPISSAIVRGIYFFSSTTWTAAWTWLPSPFERRGKARSQPFGFARPINEEPGPGLGPKVSRRNQAFEKVRSGLSLVEVGKELVTQRVEDIKTS